MGKMSESVVVRRCQMFSNIAAWIAIIAGSTVLAGWWLHLTALTSIVPGLVTMKPNTALSFLLSGVALWLLRRQPAGSQRPARPEKIAARVCAGVVLCIGTVSFIERLTNRDLGIDLLLFRDTLLATGVPHPGLMAAASGLAFLLLGGAILLLDFETTRKSNPAHALALGVVVIGFVALLGYVYGVQLLYGVSGYSAVALHTAPIFVLLGAAVLCSRPDRGLMSVLTSDRLGGLMARRLLPIFVLLPLLVGWLRLHGQRARWYQPEFGSALFSGGYVVLLAILIWICALWLNRADAARRRAEDRDEEMAAIVNSSSDAIVGKTLDGTITSWNRGAEQIYGYKEEELLGKNISLLVPPGQLDDIPRFMAEVRKGFSIERFETIRRRKDKVLIHVSLTISPVHDREGNVVGASSVARDITARKQAEERLSQSQAQLRGIIDSAMDAVITVDQNQNVVMFNAAAEKMFGYSSQEVVGLPLERLIPQKFRTGHAEHIHNFSKTGTTSRAMGALGALQGLRANGEEFPIEASISQIESNGKKFFTAIVRDVTERLRADLALREQASVLDLTQVMVRDMDGRIVLWNRGAEKLYGYKLEEALGRISHELLHTEFPEPEDLINKKLIDSGEWEGELVHRKRDGTKIVVASVWTLERHMSGRPWRILEANTDITARKRAEDAVQLAQARLLSALEGGRMGTWVWEIGTNRIVWDDPMRSLFGRDPDDITGGSIEPFFSWLHPQDRERTRAILETSLREGSSYDAEYRISRPDQSIVWIAARGRVERDAQGNAFRMTGVCIDITDRKRMEEQLLQAQKMQALGTLAGGIAHDFNNILMAIGGNASLAIDEIPADHPVQRNLHEISKASSRASNLVRQILAFSRRQAPDRKHIAVQPAVEEALGLLRATLPARIDIRSSFSPDLPPISADSTQLHQVIMNLGTNAARAIGEQRGVLEVVARPFNVTEDIAASIGKLREGSYVRLSVSDSGCGINPAIIERIFEPFFTTQAPGQGTGLGLSVAHGIMKDHDGAISVYSEHGKGSVFHLYFPAAAEFANKAATHTAPQRGHGEHLLYIDDEEALVMLATRSLGKLGYQITGYTEPVKALQAFKENPHKFAAVVTDLSMPGMSGAELARKVIEIRPDVPIVMTSGYIRPEDEVEAKQIGVRELILKPDSIDELAKALHRVFAGSAHAGTPSQPA